jgi:acyl carrier protein
MKELKEELKNKIIKELNLGHLNVQDISDSDPLFKEGLGLDSIDALELIVMLDKDYGIKLNDPIKAKKVFESIENFASYINKNRLR